MMTLQIFSTTRTGHYLPYLMLALCLLFKPALSSANEGRQTILVIGDSLSAAYGIQRDEGWVSLLRQRLDDQVRGYDVVNASVSGDTTRTGLGRLPAALREHEPDIVIIALGGNDGLRALAFDEIENSLRGMITRSRDAGASVLLAGVRLPPNNGPAYNSLFAAIYQRLADEYQLPLVAKMLEGVSDDGAQMQPDGIHPVAAAQPRILDNIWRQLVSLL